MAEGRLRPRVPCYRYDPDLGTEQEFADGVAKAHELGVHISLYMNIRLYNNAYDQAHIEDKAVMNADGSVVSESYGSLSFSTMCPGSPLWREQIAEAVEYAADAYGIDGIHFDQLGTSMHLCHNRAHLHGARTDAWYAGYQELLPKIAADFEKKHGRPLALMGEMVNDQNGCIVDVQLNQLFYNYHTHGFPEMYAYTFPEHGVIDMLYPEKNLAMRPVHIAQRCHALMARLFTNGSRFWVYDLVDDNTFGDGRFMDEDGLQYAHKGDTFLVKRFEAEDGQNFLAVFSEHPAGNRTVPACLVLLDS